MSRYKWSAFEPVDESYTYIGRRVPDVIVHEKTMKYVRSDYRQNSHKYSEEDRKRIGDKILEASKTRKT